MSLTPEERARLVEIADEAYLEYKKAEADGTILVCSLDEYIDMLSKETGIDLRKLAEEDEPQFNEARINHILDMLEEGGRVNLSEMTREERRAALFGDVVGQDEFKLPEGVEIEDMVELEDIHLPDKFSEGFASLRGILSAEQWQLLVESGSLPDDIEENNPPQEGEADD